MKDELLEELRRLQVTNNALLESILNPLKRIHESAGELILKIKKERMVCVERDCYVFAVIFRDKGWYCERHFKAMMNEE